MYLDATFCSVAVIEEEAYEVAGFNVIFDVDLHSDSTVISSHLEGNVVCLFDAHAFRLRKDVISRSVCFMFGVGVAVNLFPVVFASGIVAY